MRWEQMMYYENKKDVKRQVYVDTLNSFDAIHLTGKYAFKITHQREGKESAVFLLFHCFIWMLSHLVCSGFDSQMSFQKLPSYSLFSFLMKDLIFPLKTNTGTWDRYPYIFPILSAGFNFILSTTGEAYFLIRYRSWAVMDSELDIPQPSPHLLILQRSTEGPVPGEESKSLGLRKFLVLPLVLGHPNILFLFHQIPSLLSVDPVDYCLQTLLAIVSICLAH